MSKGNDATQSSVCTGPDDDSSVATPADAASLKDFETNAIAVEVAEHNTAVNHGRLSSWHDTVKHLIFSVVFSSEHIANPV